MRLWQLQVVVVALLVVLFLGAWWAKSALLRSISPQVAAVCEGKPTGQWLEHCREFGW